MSLVREPVVAGTFYPASAKTLRAHIEGYLEGAGEASVEGETVGMIAPHAGYMYSGQVAAFAYKAVAGTTYETVVVIAPSHRMRFRGASILECGSYRTPLGLVEVDEEFGRRLLGESDVVSARAEPHELEHSLEVQLPFLQVVLGPFKLVPIVVGEQTSEVAVRMAYSLAEVIGKHGRKSLLVGSTDLSHYYPYGTALELDQRVLNNLEAFDADGMMRDYDSESFEACGAGPMITTMVASRLLGAGRSKVMRYMNSGDVTGDRSAVVGYVSGLFYKG